MKSLNSIKVLMFSMLCLCSAHADLHLSVQEGLSDEKAVEAIAVKAHRYDVVIVASQHNKDYEDLALGLTLKINEQDSKYNCKFWEEDSSLKDVLSTGVVKTYDEFYNEFYKAVYP